MPDLEAFDGVGSLGHAPTCDCKACLLEDDQEVEGPCCSICDGLGHGYPGGGPCPLEEGGYWEARADEDRFF